MGSASNPSRTMLPSFLSALKHWTQWTQNREIQEPRLAKYVALVDVTKNLLFICLPFLPRVLFDAAASSKTAQRDGGEPNHSLERPLASQTPAQRLCKNSPRIRMIIFWLLQNLFSISTDVLWFILFKLDPNCIENAEMGMGNWNLCYNCHFIIKAVLQPGQTAHYLQIVLITHRINLP